MSTVTSRAWCAERRFGLFVHLNIASVPAFAPIHEYADWYWSHLSPEPLADVLLHPAPLPEVVAFHREHYGDTSFDDLIPHLTLEHFDADEVAELARDAGAGYLVPVTKHHDGFCWWDASHTDRSSTRMGPRRDVIAELAHSCARTGTTFGLYHSLLDWAHAAYPDGEAYVRRFLHPQVLELVERFRPAILWGDGAWGHSGEHWQSDALVEACRERMASAGLELAVNDRWGASHHDLATFEYDLPADILDEPWELCRGMAYSFCWNRAELLEHHLDARGVVGLLAEVVAKGGNLLLNLGPRADGTIPDEQAAPLREAGRWVRANADVIDGTEPFSTWGEAGALFTTSGAGRVVNVIDPTGAERLELAALGGQAGTVLRVEGAARWEQHDGVLVVSPSSTDGLATVLRVELEPRPAPTTVRPPPPAPTRSLDEALAGAAPGDEVVLEPATWTASSFPVRVPAGVTLRGQPGSAIDGGGLPFGTPVVHLDGDASALRDVEVLGAAPGLMFLSNPAITASGSADVAVDGCVVRGGIALTDCIGAVVSATDVSGGTVALAGGARCRVESVAVDGLRWGVGVHVDGGEAHRISACTVSDALAGIRVSRAAGVHVDGNEVTARWWGIHLEAATDSTVAGNVVRDTMRALTLSGGRGNTLTANRALACDSGLLLEAGAAGTEVVEHEARHCRVGLYVWDHESTSVEAPLLVGCRDADVVEQRGATL